MRINTIGSISLFLGILFASIANDALASFVSRPDHPILDYYDLLYGDIVVMGVIENIDFESAPIEEVIGEVPTPFKDDKLRLGAIRIRVNEVLKGSYESPYVVALVEWDRSDLLQNYEVGDTTIISVYYNPGLLGGTYVITSDSGRFIKHNDKWIHQAPRSISRALTLEQIRAILEQTRTDNIIVNSDLIVIGEVIDLKLSSITGPKDEKGILAKAIIQIGEVFKGDFYGKELIVSMVIGGPYWPAWRQKVPRLRVGERYYLFLKKDSMGYYPFAGVNGFFKVVDDNLIYDNRIEFAFSKRQLDNKVKMVLEDGGNESDRY